MGFRNCKERPRPQDVRQSGLTAGLETRLSAPCALPFHAPVLDLSQRKKQSRCNMSLPQTGFQERVSPGLPTRKRRTVRKSAVWNAERLPPQKNAFYHSSAGYKTDFVLNGSLLFSSLRPQSNSVLWRVSLWLLRHSGAETSVCHERMSLSVPRRSAGPELSGDRLWNYHQNTGVRSRGQWVQSWGAYAPSMVI